jgi:15-cis-phytoene synthase
VSSSSSSDTPHPNPSPEGEELSRHALVTHAQDSIAKGSRSFALASKLFGSQTRERAWLLYSWCRKCDDIADGQDHGGALSAVENPQERLAYLRSMTERALAGEATGEPAFDALRLVVQECAIPAEWPRDLIQGFAMDADAFTPKTTEDLLTYCYHVAGVVGLMMAVIMGVSPENKATLAHANDLGLAFQLANIARDVREDAEGGRCYIPADWLGEFGITTPFVSSPVEMPGSASLCLDWARHEQMGLVGARLAKMAGEYEASARIGAEQLPFRSRWAVLAAAGIYGDIARKVGQRGAGAWDSRVVTSGAGKAGWVLRALMQAF